MEKLEVLTHNGKGSTRKDSTQESTYEDGLQVLRNSDWDLEYGIWKR